MYATVFDTTESRVRLDEISAEPEKGLTRESSAREFAAFSEELFALQDLLYGARTHSVLVVLQGRDTAGKDGAIKHVVGCLNPRGVSVVSFGVPTLEEREHDFLWRVHRHAPRKGEFAIFNRSHYEDVLVARVRGLVPKSLWKERYGHIRDFEELLSEHDTIILKFFLHITKEEQLERLLEREQDPDKAWKLSVGDWEDRELWDEYTSAYEDAIERTSTRRAPWMVVPANVKWFRNLVICEALVEALRPYRKIWKQKLEAEGERGRQELDAYRTRMRG